MRRIVFSFCVLSPVVVLVAACTAGATPNDVLASEDPDASSNDAVASHDPHSDADAANGQSSVSPSIPDGPSCTSSEQCPYWYCECESGPPVNTRHCTNQRCEDATIACPSSCKSFGTCWTGIASGGWDGGSNAGPNECDKPAPPPASAGCGDGTSFTDIGKACASGASCQSGQCWGVDPSFVCTKRCNDASACPKGWKCVGTSSGFDVCLQGSLASGGSTSTNTSCGQVSFTDLGGKCRNANDCQSYVCMNYGYCSRRCETAGDCPAGWSCTTGSKLKFCTK